MHQMNVWCFSSFITLSMLGLLCMGLMSSEDFEEKDDSFKQLLQEFHERVGQTV